MFGWVVAALTAGLPAIIPNATRPLRAERMRTPLCPAVTMSLKNPRKWEGSAQQDRPSARSPEGEYRHWTTLGSGL